MAAEDHRFLAAEFAPLGVPPSSSPAGWPAKSVPLDQTPVPDLEHQKTAAPKPACLHLWTRYPPAKTVGLQSAAQLNIGQECGSRASYRGLSLIRRHSRDPFDHSLNLCRPFRNSFGNSFRRKLRLSLRLFRLFRNLPFRGLLWCHLS